MSGLKGAQPTSFLQGDDVVPVEGAPVEPALVAHWTLDAVDTDFDAHTTTDVSDTHYVGSMSSGIEEGDQVGGKLGQAIGFETEGPDYISVAGNSALAPETLSIMFWFDPSGLEGENGYLIDYTNDSNAGWRVDYVIGDGDYLLQFQYNNGSQNNAHITIPNLNFNHLAITYDGAGVVLFYLNGNNQGQGTGKITDAGPIQVPFGPGVNFVIGASNDTVPVHGTSGLLDDIVLYSGVLDAGQITTIKDGGEI